MFDINNVQCKHTFPYSMGVAFGNLKCIKLIMVKLWRLIIENEAFLELMILHHENVLKYI